MDIEAYCDESRQDYFAHAGKIAAGHYVLIGSLWLEALSRSEIKSKIRALRQKHNLHGEFKWKRVSPSRQVFYTDLIDLFFDEQLRFRCIVLPANQLDVITFHSGDNELMFYKFYYLMLRAWILEFNRYRIFVDMKTNRIQRLSKLTEVLRNTNRFAKIEPVQALPSHEVDLLQFVDVLIGAVGYRFHATITSQAKLAVVTAIEDHLKHPIRPTSKSQEKFNIFSWRPGGGW